MRRFWQVGCLVVALLGNVSGCSGRACPGDICLSGAGLGGTIELPVGTLAVDTEYCGERSGCLGGRVDLRHLDQGQVCTGSSVDSHICFSLDGGVKVEAWIRGTGPMPPDGEQFTLTVVDHDSGQVLVDVTRVANYEVMRDDDCHYCWSASMSF